MEYTGTKRRLLSVIEDDPRLDDEKIYVCEIKEKKRKRSLNANSYFHVLCDKLRQKLNISMAHCKNLLITSYGQIDYLDPDRTEPLIYKTNAPPEYIQEREEVHMELIKISEEKGKPVYFYRMYRGSHTYDTAEMSKLIEGTVQECVQQDIETATPDEIAKMIALWGNEFNKHKQAG